MGDTSFAFHATVGVSFAFCVIGSAFLSHETAPGSTGDICLLGTLEGTFAGEPFAGRMRYTRTWAHTNEYGRRVLAAHAGPA